MSKPKFLLIYEQGELKLIIYDDLPALVNGIKALKRQSEVDKFLVIRLKRLLKEWSIPMLDIQSYIPKITTETSYEVKLEGLEGDISEE
jgi:hypothetical protein